MFVVELLVLAALCAFGYAFGYAQGRERGIRSERGRVLSLFQQSFSYRISMTVQWILNTVSSGGDELAPEDEFFGPPPTPPKSDTHLRVVGNQQ